MVKTAVRKEGQEKGVETGSLSQGPRNPMRENRRRAKKTLILRSKTRNYSGSPGDAKGPGTDAVWESWRMV